MAYNDERYIYYTGCYCERCSKQKGIRTDDQMTRILVVKENNGGESYMCTACVGEQHMILTAKLNTLKSSLNLTFAEIQKYLDPSSRKVGVTAEAMRSTMTRFDEVGRDLLKKIRAFDGPYTDRNRVCKDIQDLLKNMQAAVEAYLQKT